jgi:anaerobic dimethyl sulfoxide reductase subunit B (iron-sulfur subunit)
MQLGFFFDQSRCSGCLTCVVACRQWHSVDHDAVTWRRVETIEKGSFPDLRVSFLSLSCLHCRNCPCIPSCPTSAITKREQDGIVLVDPSKCVGGLSCGQCREVCPYGMPQFNPEQESKMEKCNFCSDRLAQDKRPICVEACPMRALDAGDLEEMKKKHGMGTEAEGFHYFFETGPSIILRRK